jgi:hypothetical protein
MVSGIGGGMSGMPSMDAMRQMQQRSFTKADANGSGGLDATEFQSMIKDSPMGAQASQGINTQEMFEKIDGDGNGELSQAELQDAQTQIMSGFQSTMQAFGSGSGASSGSSSSQDSLQTLLRSIGQGDSRGGTSAADGSSGNDLVKQLRSLMDKVSSTYSAGGQDLNLSLLAAA